MKTVLNYPGAKYALSEWICSYIPEHIVYVEPFFGSGGIFFNKEESKIEAINDINNDVVNYFKVLRDNPADIIEQISLTPFSQVEYEAARVLNENDSDIERARKFAIKCFMGIGNSTVHRTGFRRSKEKGSPSKAKTWDRLPTELQRASQRIKNAQIECMDAIEMIKRYDNGSVFLYCDPPYLLSTRKGYLYQNEMTDEQHIELLEVLNNHKGKVMISGYDNDLYNSMLKGWQKEYKNASSEKGRRVEVLWMNYDIQMKLF